MPQKYRSWKRYVQVEAKAQGVRLMSGPLGLILEFRYPAKARTSKKSPPEWKATRDDIDNLAKGVMDALQGVAFRDDGQVAVLHCSKVRLRRGAKPSTLATIYSLEGDPPDV